MAASLGSAALALAFLTAVFAAVAALLGGARASHRTAEGGATSRVGGGTRVGASLPGGGSATVDEAAERWLRVSRRAVYTMLALLTLCVVLIELAFARNDFSLRIVQQHSSIETPSFYKLAAMWSSQEGSLLLWAWVLSIASSVALYATRDKLRELVPYATAVMAAIAAFFTGLMLFAGGVNPFATLSRPPADGIGLNPLLQHPSMMIHPPMLYSGYVAFTIPFAFAIGALVTRRLDAAWIRATRRFALIAWALLGFGLLLGARWSYSELGWGGYWAWDPVENAALMPWLAGTAFLHSIMVQEKRGMLKAWNAFLIVATFSLALLGTFLVRSGVLQSIHAFGDNTVGPYILGLIAVVAIGSAALIVSRLDDLRSEKRIDSLASREAVFLVNNLLLVALCATILWGTLFPLIAELFTGNKASLAAPWFDRYTTPLAILLVLFTGIGPLLAWRRVSWASAKRVFLRPAVFAAAVATVLLLATDAARKPWAFALFVFAAFALAGLAQEFWQGAAARRSISGGSMPSALLAVTSRNRRRYGGYVVHAGVAVLLIGIAASSSFQTKRDVTLRPGQSAVVDGRKVIYVRPTASVDKLAFTAGAGLRVEKDGEAFTLRPTRRFYRPTGVAAPAISDYFAGESDSEIGLRAGVGSDFWTAEQPGIAGVQRHARAADAGFKACVAGGPGTPPQCKAVGVLMRAALANPSLRAGALAKIEQLQLDTAKRIAAGYVSEAAPATFRVIVNPLVTWIWIGGLIALAGALIAVWPARSARRRPAGDTELEALKEAKYREIRDAELDHAAGKLSDEDFALLDAELRSEAIEILDRANGGHPSAPHADDDDAGDGRVGVRSTESRGRQRAPHG